MQSFPVPAISVPVTPAGIPAFSRYAVDIGRRCDAHSWPTLGVRDDRSGAGEDAGLEQLRRRYPRWSIWRGGFTGDYWAMPPRGHPTRRELISARDLGELAQRLAEAEWQYDV